MSFLLDTNVCSAFLKTPRSLTHRFIQYSGRLYLSTIVLAELRTWASGSSRSITIHRKIDELIPITTVIQFDELSAAKFGEIRAKLMPQGINIPTFDLLIGATALAHDLTMVTHNISDFSRVPELRVVDWLAA